MPKPKSTSRQASPEAPELHDDPDDQLDPIIDGLLDRLPAPGDPWPKADRQKWLQLMTMALDLIYVDEPPPGG